MGFKSNAARNEWERGYNSQPDVAHKRSARFKRWREENRDHLNAKEAERRLTKRAQCLIANARTRARNRGLIFDLDAHVDEIQGRIDLGYCELTGTPFDLTPGRKFNSPSLDRIKPSDGYVIGNIRVVCHAVNAAMGDWGEGPLRLIIEHWSAMESMRKSPKNS